MKVLEDDLKRLLIGGVGLGISLLWFSMYLRDVELDSAFVGSGKAIGYIEKYELDVTRRPRTRLLWLPVSASSQVFEKDTLRTGPDSIVVINLGTKGRVELRPQSLAVLETEGEDFRINLASGDLFLKGDVVARVGDTEVKSKGSSFGLSRDSLSGQLKVESQKGSIELIQQGKRTELKEGDLLIEGQNGEKKLLKLPLARALPADGAEVKVKKASDPISLSFKWIHDSARSQNSELKTFSIEVSKDKNFKTILKKMEAPSEFLATQMPLSIGLPEEGSYFWRAVDSQGAALSSIGRFTLKFPAVWKWMPGKGESEASQEHSILGDLTDKGLSWDLAWTGPKEARFHKIQIKTKETQIAEIEVGSARSLRWRSLENSISNALRKLRAEDLADLSLELTALDVNHNTLVDKPLTASLMLNDSRLPTVLLQLNAQVQKDPRQTKLSWSFPTDIKEAEILIGTEKIITKEASLDLDTEKALAALDQRKLKIRSRSMQGLAGNWQEWDLPSQKLKEALSFKSPAVLLIPVHQKVVLIQDGEAIEFRWRALGTNEHRPKIYKLRVRKASGERVEEKNIPEPLYKLVDLRPGLYRWDIQAQWENDTWGPWSESREFEVRHRSLQAPSFRSPASSTK